MSRYINPNVPDGDERLRSRINDEHERILWGVDPLDSFDRAHRIATSRRPPPIPAGWSPIPGQSRSGALDPQTRARFERREAEGEIELLRTGTAWPHAWREIADVSDA